MGEAKCAATRRDEATGTEASFSPKQWNVGKDGGGASPSDHAGSRGMKAQKRMANRNGGAAWSCHQASGCVHKYAASVAP